MKSRKKYIGIFITGIVLILLVGTVSAFTVYEQERYSEIDSFFTKLRYGIEKGLFFFTSWGEQNDCSTFPDWDGWISKGETVDCGDVGKEKCAIDIWYDNIIYLSCPPACGPPASPDWDNWLKEEHGVGASFTANVYQNYYIEIYGCPLVPPPIGDWSTRVYVCEEPGIWDRKSRYDSDEFCPYDTSGEDLCWCNEEDENFYVDEAGGVHCRDSPRDSWCSTYVAHDKKQCVTGATTSLYWYDNRGDRNDLIEECSSDERCTLDGCVLSDGNGDEVIDECNVNTVKSNCLGDVSCVWIDPEHWWLNGNCVTGIRDGNGDGDEDIVDEEIKSFNISKIGNIPSSSLKDAICSDKRICPSNSECKIIQGFIDDKDVTETRMKVTREAFCVDYDKVLDFSLLFDNDYHKTCKALTGKQEYFQNNFGICVFGEEESQITQFLKSIGRKIPITNDPLTDGIIVSGGGLLLLMILLTRLNFGIIKHEI